jgi:beta/gamma crystallin
MKRIATILAAGALALFASLLVMVETADQANAFMRLGGFGGFGGMRSFGGGMRSLGGGMRSLGGGMRSLGGGMRSFAGARSFGGGGSAMMRSNVSAQHISTMKHVNVGRTNTVSHVNVSKGSSVKHANIRNAPSSKHVNVAKTNTSKNITKATTGTLADVRKPNIGKQVGIANLGVTHVNAGNTNKVGQGGIMQPGNRLAGSSAGLAGPGGIKPGPGLKPSPVGGLHPPPGGFKPAPGSITVINDRYVNIFRGPRQIWWAGAWVSLAALAVMPAVYIGGIDYEPYGYVSLAEPICSGVTPEGYRLTWRDVPTDTGATIPQCVAYYPRGRAAPAVATGAVPGRSVGAAQPVTSAMAQGCLVEIYSEAAFTGMSSDVAADQPRLSEYGWDKQISSLDLKSGTWDFYSEPDYGGQVVRLPPGRYENLEGWDKLIGSFMCTQINDSRDWARSKNPAAPAVRREAEEDWARRSGGEPAAAGGAVWDDYIAKAK